jgi:hypothetical protein
MKLWIHGFRTVFISPEVLGVLILVLVKAIWPGIFEFGDALVGKLSWIPMAPAGAAMLTSIGVAWKLLFPAKNSKLLTQYPRYPELRLTTLCSVAFVGIGTLAIAIGIAGHGEFWSGVSSLLVSAGYWCGGVACFSLLAAALTIRSLIVFGN